MVLKNDLCCVEITIDSMYVIDSSNNLPYDIVHNPLNYKRSNLYTTFSIHIDCHGIKRSIALIGDCHSIDTDCAILDGNTLTVLQNDTLIQLRVIDGEIIFCKDLDSFGCNFGIYRIDKGYIIYGETEIVMLDLNFNKRWDFSGKDIFVSITGKTAFSLGKDSICLYDFDDNYYEIDYKGNLLTFSAHH